LIKKRRRIPLEIRITTNGLTVLFLEEENRR
jgi:hypothetical protein